MPSDFLLSGGAAIRLLISQHMVYSLRMYKEKVRSYIFKMLRVILYMVCIVQYINFTNFPGHKINSQHIFVAPNNKNSKVILKNISQYFMFFFTREKPWYRDYSFQEDLEFSRLPISIFSTTFARWQGSRQQNSPPVSISQSRTPNDHLRNKRACKSG